jgi:enamine deaminase RidA (YjgF/YER057c/UK114 family)
VIVARLAELGYPFEVPESDNGRFFQAVRSGNLVFVSGQLPVLGDEEIKGKVGTDVTFEQAERAAELCAYNCLRAVATVADLDSIERIIKVFGMVNVGGDFDDTAGVINACSRFLRTVLGERGWHARSAVGMVIPAGWAVEIEMVVALSDGS